MKRGQAAMEFLMTYGWALLIVLVAIAVLAAMGVFGGKGSFEACFAGVGISCKDFKIQRVVAPGLPDNGVVEVQFLNGFGKDITEFFVTVDPAMRICPGITGVVASLTLNGLQNSIPQRLNADETLPVLRADLTSFPFIGLSCDHVYSNCCNAYNNVFSLPAVNSPIRVPCTTPPAASGCVGIGPPGSGQGRVPDPGKMIKLEFFITYRFGDSMSLIHSRKGSIASIVESP